MNATAIDLKQEQQASANRPRYRYNGMPPLPTQKNALRQG